MTLHRTPITLFVVFFLLACAKVSYGGAIVWVGGSQSNANWNNPANWSGGVVPIAIHTAAFQGEITVRFTTLYSSVFGLGALSLSDSAQVTLDPDRETWRNAPEMSINDSAHLTIGSQLHLKAIGTDINGTGTFELAGEFRAIQGTCEISGNLTVIDHAGALWTSDYIGVGDVAVLKFNNPDSISLNGDFNVADSLSFLFFLSTIETTGSFFSAHSCLCDAFILGSTGDFYWTGTSGESVMSSPCLH